MTTADVAEAMGWQRVPVPGLAVKATQAAISRIPFLPAQTQWVKAVSIPVLMDSAKAARELGWVPGVRHRRDARRHRPRRPRRRASLVT